MLYYVLLIDSVFTCESNDGPLKITIGNVTWSPSRNKAFTYVLTYLPPAVLHARVTHRLFIKLHEEPC